MTTSFWKDALASLPPSVQRRYAASFEAAEHFEALLDLGVEAWGFAKHALAKICQAAARTMRGTARILEGVRTGCCPCIDPTRPDQEKSPGFAPGLLLRVLVGRQKVSDLGHPVLRRTYRWSAVPAWFG